VTSRLETLDRCGKDADAVDIAFLGMTAKQLLSYADTQYGLLQTAYDLVETVGPKISHGCLRTTLSGEDDLVGLGDT
jgi:hypothetical protein